MNKTLSTLILLLVFISCKRHETVIRPDIEAYIGNIKTAPDDSCTYYIYISLILINNTDHNYFLKNHKPEFPFFEDSFFYGIVGNDTISFNAYMSGIQIKPEDTLIFCLFQRYKTEVLKDALFNQIKCMDIYYSMPEDSIMSEEMNIRFLRMERQDSSKFVLLDKSKGVGKAFLYGMDEFKPYLIDTTRSSYDKSLVTGEYIYDLCK